MNCYLADIGHHHSLKQSHGDKRNGSKQKEREEKRKGIDSFIKPYSELTVAKAPYLCPLLKVSLTENEWSLFLLHIDFFFVSRKRKKPFLYIVRVFWLEIWSLALRFYFPYLETIPKSGNSMFSSFWRHTFTLSGVHVGFPSVTSMWGCNLGPSWPF